MTGLTGIELQRQNAQTTGYNMKADPMAANQDITKWKYGEPYLVLNANTSNTVTVSSTSSMFTEWTLAYAAGYFSYCRYWIKFNEASFRRSL